MRDRIYREMDSFTLDKLEFDKVRQILARFCRCSLGSNLALRIGPSRRPEVALLAEASLPTVVIERHDEDYLLTSQAPVVINNAALTRKLLAGGDRIELSRRCRLRFAVPNPASTSAVVQVSGARLPQTDARSIILMDQSLVIGPTASAHVRAGQVVAPVVLYVRDDRLLCRAGEPVMLAGQRLQESGEIVLGAKVEIGNLSFVVTNAVPS